MQKFTALFVYSDSESTLRQGVIEFQDMKSLTKELSDIFAVHYIENNGSVAFKKENDNPVNLTNWEDTTNGYINLISSSIDKLIPEVDRKLVKFYVFKSTSTSLGLVIGGWGNYENLFLQHI